MSFVAAFNALPIPDLLRRAAEADASDVRRILASGPRTLPDFAALLSPAAAGHLETLCLKAQTVTQQRFGKVIRLFAPLYLSNECVNNCAYCGFSRDNGILRVTLSVDDVVREARALCDQGFRNILLVAGEHPKFVSNGYLRECIEAVHAFVPSISLEVGPMETADYVPLVHAGADGLVVYQETYDREIYARMHTAGPKRNFDWRLECPERAAAAGFRRLGIGALHGLADWRLEALATAAHAQYLLKHCWKSMLTLSIPRLRPCAGEFQPLTQLGDREFVQLIAAFRLLLPDVGIVLSTREPAALRNGLLPLGVTHASAGSHTEPGGYTGAGRDSIHQTVRGRIVELAAHSSEWAPIEGRATNATGQFDIADDRAPSEFADLIRSLGYEPVWKDWDSALSA
ncbi:MAG: 2-iminoacetate synthase ThiH [Verrucomicrobiales bacterium]|nr:2-iminoacetate synthase ThiH [Verrucomicrobiales bacterium]